MMQSSLQCASDRRAYHDNRNLFVTLPVMSGTAKVKVQYCQHLEQWLDSNLFVTLPSPVASADAGDALLNPGDFE
jgi:hypothetical protein